MPSYFIRGILRHRGKLQRRPAVSNSNVLVSCFFFFTFLNLNKYRYICPLGTSFAPNLYIVSAVEIDF